MNTGFALGRWRGQPMLPKARGSLLPSRPSIPKCLALWLGIGAALVCLLAQAVIVQAADAQSALSAENAARFEAATACFSEEVRRDDWTNAAEQLQRIIRVVQPLFTSLDAAASPPGKAIARAVRAVHHRDRPGALHAANKMKLWAALERAKSSDVAPEVARLGFLARELEIDLDEGNTKKGFGRVGQARQCWEQLRPLLEKRAAAQEIQQGDAVLRTTVAADNPEALRQVRSGLMALAKELEQEFNGDTH